MKKNLIYFAIALMVMAATIVLAAEQAPTEAEACKAYGDYIDSRTWDLELLSEYPSAPYHFIGNLNCYDPHDGRWYTATHGAARIAWDAR